MTKVFVENNNEITDAKDRELNTIIYDFVETYEVVPVDGKNKYDEQDKMFLFFATILLVSIYYSDSESITKEDINFNDYVQNNWLIGVDIPTDSSGVRNTRQFIGKICTQHKTDQTKPLIFSEKILNHITIYSADLIYTLIDSVVRQLAKRCIGSNIHYIIGPLIMTYIRILLGPGDTRTNLYQVPNNVVEKVLSFQL